MVNQIDSGKEPESEVVSDFAWCLHCERTYSRGLHRVVDDQEMCPYPECDGDIDMDGWDWEQVRSENPDYTEIPIEGVIYPFHRSRPEST